MNKLEAAIAYLLNRPRRFRLTRTEVVKYLYLADLAYFKAHGKTLTGVDYAYYYYGPFNEEIVNTLERMSGTIIRKTAHLRSLGDSEYYLYESSKPISVDPLLSPEEKRIIDDVVGRWYGRRLKTLLRYVYEETEPMRKARPGDTDIIRRYANP